jgi:hypothetical protein
MTLTCYKTQIMLYPISQNQPSTPKYFSIQYTVDLSINPSTTRICGMDFIDMAHDRDQKRALVNTVMNLWVP